MKLILRRLRLAELLLGTNLQHAPTFQLRHELFRLGRGTASVVTVAEDDHYVELELERITVVPHADAHIILRPRDIHGGEDGQLWRRGKPVTAL